MTQLSISVYGAELVRKGSQNLRADVPKISRERIYGMEQTVVRRMKGYWTMGIPPALPGYNRTGALAAGYFISATTNGYRITNNVPYTKYVVGNAHGLEQAWMHARPGRHKLLRDVQEEEVAKLPWTIEQHVVMVARQLGFEAIAIGASYGL